MKKQDNIKTNGFNFEPMPATMTDEAAERQAREKVTQQLTAIIGKITKFRENGVEVTDEDELRQLTPTAIRDQIALTRARRLGEKFLPPAIRQAEEKEFASMERTLLPLARDLQYLLKNVPFSIHVAEKAEETYFNSEQTEEWIQQAATVVIPEDVRGYYNELQRVCAAWYSLVQWCAGHQFEPPTMSVLNKLTDNYLTDRTLPDHLRPAVLSLSPDQMFSLWKYGIIKHLPPDNT